MSEWLWAMFNWLCFNVPWLLLAAAAALLWTRRKKSYPILLQALGAAGTFAMAILQWLVFSLLTWTHATLSVTSAAWTIFRFLEWVCLMIFVVGFCWEKILQWREPKSVIAVPMP